MDRETFVDSLRAARRSGYVAAHCKDGRTINITGLTPDDAITILAIKDVRLEDVAFTTWTLSPPKPGGKPSVH
jgi:hypothetical protein